MRSFKQSILENNKEVKVIVVYAIALICSLILIEQLFKDGLFEASNFLNWDAEHYFYNAYHPYEGYRAAFFPLLSLIWKWFSLDAYGVVILNSLIYFCSVWVLAVNLKMSTRSLLICITLPVGLFFYLPYTESLFFLSSTLIIVGLKKDKLLLIVIGLFISALTRPAFVVFIPALLIAEIFGNSYSNKQFDSRSVAILFNSKLIKRMSLYLLALFAGTIIVIFLQHRDTNEWFSFLSAQKGWGNHLQWPKFPLTSWAGGYIVRIDGTAFMIGTLAGSFLLLWLLGIKKLREISIPKEVIFSLAYLGGITLSVFAFRGGSLFSLNRFVYATAFMFVAINFFLNLKVRYSLRSLLYILLMIIAFWMIIFHSYSHIRYFLKFAALALYMLLPFCLLSDNKVIQKAGFIILILCNMSFQIILFLRFLEGGWVA